MVDIMKEFASTVKDIYKTHNEELVSAKAQTKLLEDSESRTKREFQELQAENKHLIELKEEILLQKKLQKNLQKNFNTIFPKDGALLIYIKPY